MQPERSSEMAIRIDAPPAGDDAAVDVSPEPAAGAVAPVAGDVEQQLDLAGAGLVVGPGREDEGESNSRGERQSGHP